MSQGATIAGFAIGAALYLLGHYYVLATLTRHGVAPGRDFSVLDLAIVCVSMSVMGYLIMDGLDRIDTARLTMVRVIVSLPIVFGFCGVVMLVPIGGWSITLSAFIGGGVTGGGIALFYVLIEGPRRIARWVWRRYVRNTSVGRLLVRITGEAHPTTN